MFKPIEQVLVPVDFSRSSRAAYELARRLREPAPTCDLVHVIEPLAPYIRAALFPFAGMGEDEVELLDEFDGRARKVLEAQLDLQDADTLRIEHGLRAERLAEVVASSSADVVVAGAFGEGGAVPETLGSTAARLLRVISRPILLTRSLSERVPRVGKILCAVDLSPASAEVLEWALGMALSLGAELETAFVLPDPLSQDPNNLLSGHVRFSHQKVIDRERPKLDALFERTRKAVDVPYPERGRVDTLWKQREILFGDPAQAILDRADAIEADLIVLGTRNLQTPSSGNLGRVSWSVTRRATKHVLLVPLARQAKLLDSED